MSATQNQNTKKGTELIALWKKTSKEGKAYFTGKQSNGVYVTGFYVTNKKNPKEPDLRIYLQGDDGKLGKEVASLWCNVSERTGNKYLTGTLHDGTKIVGFIQKKESNNPTPYLRIYLQTDKPKEPKKEELKSSENKVIEPKF